MCMFSISIVIDGARFKHTDINQDLAVDTLQILSKDSYTFLAGMIVS